ncbi:Rieske 2Fe-2S domain-containing protein [Labrenzia sp. 011]|uniref:Rieske 2Fe-2S domain-containing protein n=1 Tax=Labrenzia sp. 011 TaxID=2171494 RepID=UPI000D515199|nr:Rieske 2Fe-2S domain-containing protein [Labrenzia sp. 011]PVB61786.1 (2Fe-2S)-binding protein [Labrenzia sp. 011]
MSVQYTPVLWNRNKILYDAALLIAVALYLYVFIRVGPMFEDVTRPIDGAILRMRAFGSCAFLMLTVILCIGPLARLDRRFLPLLYNRRHFGVMTAGIAAVHANYVLGWYFSFSPTDKYVALLASNTGYTQLLGFPFEALGIAALLILFVLAATSHDFWLSFLGAPLWKALHMTIYAAYVLVVLHVALGALQGPGDPVLTTLVAAGVILVCGLHLAAGRMEAGRDRGEETARNSPEETGWVVACEVGDIDDDCARVVTLDGGERVAIFKYDGKLSAITNVCAHQNGPLGEGKVLWGCITCPWHGYQYNLADGRAPAPFTEKVSTYRLKLAGATVLLDPDALPPGTHVDPVEIGGAA